MKQSPENWREVLPKIENLPEVHNWWRNWYDRIVKSQEATNAMPFVFDTQAAAGVEPRLRNPREITVDQPFVKDMYFGRQQPLTSTANVTPSWNGPDPLQEILGLLKSNPDLLSRVLALTGGQQVK